MTQEQLTQNAIDNSKEIAVVHENVRILDQKLESMDKKNEQKFNDMEKITDEIHKLALNVGLLASEVKSLAEDVRQNQINTHTELKEYKEEISQKFENQGKRLGILEGQSGKRWNSVVDKIVTGIVGALVAYCAFKLGLQ